MKRLMTLTSLAMILALSATPAALAGSKRPAKSKPDRGRPTTQFNTPDDATFSNAVLTDSAERMVAGRAGDRRSKIRLVNIEIKPCKSESGPCDASDVRADEAKLLSISGSALHCGPKGKVCRWSFEAPETLGPYQLRAWSYDRAGHRSHGDIIRITVTV